MSSHLTDAERETLDEVIYAAMSYVTPRPDPDTMWDYLMDAVASNVGAIIDTRLAAPRRPHHPPRSTRRTHTCESVARRARDASAEQGEL